LKSSAAEQAYRSMFRLTVLVAALVLAAVPAFAAIEGTVTNGTTNKPASGDEVVLLELSQGMNEAGHTKTDASGHYKFDVATTGGGPHLVRVSHENVNYFRMVPPGMSSGDVTIYEAAKKVDGLSYNIETAFQGGAGTLQVVQFYVVRNQSQPPRTQAADAGLEIAIPQEAKIDSADVQAPGGQPIQTAPNPKGKGRYAFDYPLRPGETTFRLMYHLPYSGEMTFKPTLLYPVGQFAIIMPPSMSFQATNSGTFNSQPHQGGVNIQIANNIPANADLSYRISGTGQMPENTGAADQGDSGGGMGSGDQTAQGGRPGGGLGNPIDAPDPLTKYRWPLLFGFAVLLVFGAFYIVTHRQPAPEAAQLERPTLAAPLHGSAERGAPPEQEAEAPVPLSRQKAAVAQGRSSLLLDAMKEELFQLEVDRQQGHISQDEYAKTKAALDATLKRALSRQSREAAS
jgi:hypothetical protein